MSFKFFSIALFTLCLAACSGNNDESTRRSELLKDPEGVKPEKPDLLAAVPFKTLPVSDSTSFDNFNGEDKLSKKLVSELQLKSIDPNYENFHSRYRIAHTTAVDMMVVTLAAENEMKTFLISYSKEDYKLIDKVIITYDEIAESAFSSTGKITKNEVIVTNYNYMDEEPVIDVKKYRIEQSGKFTPVKY